MRLWFIGLVMVAMASTNSSTASGDLLVRESQHFASIYGYGGSSWSTITGQMDAATTVTEVANFNDALQVNSADALWIDVGPFLGGTSLSASEVTNITNFIASGKRVVMIGENSSGWSGWNTEILGLVGGTDSGITFSGDITSVVSNSITASADTVFVSNGGAAATSVGGTALYSQNVITLWGTNVLTVLDFNMLDDIYLPEEQNVQLAQNIVDWVTNDVAPVPEPTSLAIFGIGALGMVGTRRRRKRA